MGWEEFTIAEELKDILFELIGENGLPRGFLSRLSVIYSLYIKNEQQRAHELRRSQVSLEEYKKRIFYDRWLWRLVYHLARSERFYEAQGKAIKKLQQKLIDEKSIPLLGLVSRWIEFLTRNK